MNPTDYKLKVDFSRGSLRPKRRCKPAEVTAIAATLPLTIASLPPMPRIKRSADPHPQIWLRPAAAESRMEVKRAATPNLEATSAPVTRSSRSAPGFEILRGSNYQALEYLKHLKAKALEVFSTHEPHLKAKALDIFHKYQPRVLVGLKRVATLAVTLAALRAHDSAKL